MFFKRFCFSAIILLLCLCIIGCDPDKNEVPVPESEENCTLLPADTWFKEQPTGEPAIEKWEIRTVSFVKTKPEGTPVKEWNADVAKSGDIKCCVYGTAGNYELYIVGEKIKGHEFSCSLFEEFYCLVSIFFGHFDTSNVTDMQFAFYKCMNLSVLDLGNFNPSSIIEKIGMFGYCGKLGTVIKIDSKYADFFNNTELGLSIFWSYSSGIYTCIADQICEVRFYDGTNYCPIDVEYGDFVDPTSLDSYVSKDGYSFFGWYYDGDCTDYFDGSKPIKEDTILYARWAPGEDSTAYVGAYINLKELPLQSGDKVTAVFSTGDYSNTLVREITDSMPKNLVIESYVLAAEGSIKVSVESSEGVLKGSKTTDCRFKNEETYDITILEDGVNYYSVNFDTDGGAEISSQLIKEGNTVCKPPVNPTKKDYVFAGWYTGNGGSGTEYDFTTPVSKDFTLYAKWTESVTKEKWCVMTYMDFSNLTSYGLKNLDEICQSTPNANVKAYFLTGGSDNSSCNINNYPNLASAIEAYNPSDPFASSSSPNTYQLWEYTSGGKFKEITPLLKGMNDPDVLSDFMEYCYTMAEESDPNADFKYILELWDHGGGSYVGLVVDSAIQEKTSETNIMSLAGCANSIKSVTAKKGFKFEVVVFDMCLMQSYEIAHAVSFNCAKYIIGSQTSSAAEGSAYTDWFNFLYQHPEANGYEFGKAFCDYTYTKTKNNGSTTFFNNVTWSVLDMSKFAEVETLFEAYVASDLASVSASTVESCIATIDSIPAFEPFYSFWDYYMYDINVFTGTVGNSAARNALIQAIEKAVVYKKYGKTQEIAGCCGLSMCILTNSNKWNGWKFSKEWNENYLNSCLTTNYRNFQKRITDI